MNTEIFNLFHKSFCGGAHSSGWVDRGTGQEISALIEAERGAEYEDGLAQIRKTRTPGYLLRPGLRSSELKNAAKNSGNKVERGSECVLRYARLIDYNAPSEFWTVPTSMKFDWDFAPELGKLVYSYAAPFE